MLMVASGRLKIHWSENREKRQEKAFLKKQMRSKGRNNLGNMNLETKGSKYTVELHIPNSLMLKSECRTCGGHVNGTQKTG